MLKITIGDWRSHHMCFLNQGNSKGSKIVRIFKNHNNLVSRLSQYRSVYCIPAGWEYSHDLSWPKSLFIHPTLTSNSSTVWLTFSKLTASSVRIAGGDHANMWIKLPLRSTVSMLQSNKIERPQIMMITNHHENAATK